MRTVVFPYHQDLAMFNNTLKDSNIRFVFTSRNTIGRAVVSKKTTKLNDSSRSSGVYAIECNVPDCNLAYFGRSLKFHTRMTQHANDLRDNNSDSPLVKHITSHPGHNFNPRSARLLWNTRNKQESQLVEAACIKRFPSCNRSPGEVKLSDIYSSLVTNMAGIRGPRQLTTLEIQRQIVTTTPSDNTVSSNPLPTPPPSAEVVSIHPTDMQPNYTIHCSQVAGPSGLQQCGINLPDVISTTPVSQVTSIAVPPPNSKGKGPGKRKRMPAASTASRQDNISDPPLPHSIYTRTPTLNEEPPAQGITTIPIFNCETMSVNPRDTHIALPHRVSQLRNEHIVSIDRSISTDVSNIPFNTSTQPPPLLNQSFHVSHHVPTSQPVINTNMDFSPRRTRSQGHKTNFKQL